MCSAVLPLFLTRAFGSALFLSLAKSSWRDLRSPVAHAKWTGHFPSSGLKALASAPACKRTCKDNEVYFNTTFRSKKYS